MGTSAELPLPLPTRNTGCGAGDFDAKGDLEGKTAAAAAGDLEGKGDFAGKGDLEGKGDFAAGVGAVLMAATGVLAAGVFGRVGEMCCVLTGGRAGDLTAEARA